MQFSFASPAGALIGLAVLLPLAALLELERRSQRVRRLLGLRGARRTDLLPYAAASLATATLVALAAAQPIVAVTEPQVVRTDIEVFVVLDTSRSMLAASGPDERTRFERARAVAEELRATFADVPMGIASLTDRLLPHLFPTTDQAAFAATLAKAVAVDRPPPQDTRARATSFSALADAPTWNFFSEEASRRLLVVLTDGEGQGSDPEGLASGLQDQPSVELSFVHLWHEDERVFSQGRAEPEYEADADSGPLLERVAGVADGEVFMESEVAGLITALRQHLASSAQTPSPAIAGPPRPLAPYAIAIALLPLGFLVWRRARA